MALVGLSACTSDPSAKRVAQDLVNTITMEPGGGGEKVRDCMLEVIDGYSKDELEAIGDDALSDNAEDEGRSGQGARQVRSRPRRLPLIVPPRPFS